VDLWLDCIQKNNKMISTIEIQNKAISDYLNSRSSLKDIARKYNYSGGWLLNVLKRNNIKPRNKSEHKVDLNKENLAVNDYVKGEFLKDIASKYNVSRRTITEWVKKHGVKPLNYNERLGITDELKAIAKRMYFDELMNCSEIGRKLNVSGRSVLDWVGENKRTKSEISCIMASNGLKKSRGLKGILSTRFGLITYDSSYERDRIIQLSDNQKVVKLNRCKFFIKYDNKNYNPDFTVTYDCGCVYIEEIKPLPLLNTEINIKKFKSAIEYCKQNNLIFSIITEKEIYGKK
jgi:predicted DNA-binding protein YlxM (UPF0122 family)